MATKDKEGKTLIVEYGELPTSREDEDAESGANSTNLTNILAVWKTLPSRPFPWKKTMRSC